MTVATASSKRRLSMPDAVSRDTPSKSRAVRRLAPIQWPHGSRARSDAPCPRVAEGGLRPPARARRAVHHDLRRAGQAPLHRGGPGRQRPGARHRLSGRLPVHARRVPVDVPRAAVDDAPVRRIRHGGGDQRAVPLPARPRADGPLDGVRHADADGPRLRQRALARRGRARGRCDRHARRHGDAVRRHPARRGHDLDDDQRAGGDPARVLRMRGGAPGRVARPARRHDPDRHPEGVHRAEGMVLPDRPGDADRHRHGRVLLARASALASDLDLGLPHPRGRLDRAAGAGVHARRRLRLRAGRRRARAWRSTTSRPACPSSSTRTSTSSRRSRSTAPRAASGRARCATPSVRPTRRRGACASTARPQASR